MTKAQMDWLTFSIDQNDYGIESEYVYRVIEDVQIAPIPFMPNAHLGLIYYRGELFDVVDLKQLLQGAPGQINGNSRIILVKWVDKKLALIPERISGMLWDEQEADTPRESYGTRERITLLKPEQVWQRMLNLSYGYREV